MKRNVGSTRHMALSATSTGNHAIGKNKHLIAFIRPCGTKTAEAQREEIAQFCKRHGFSILKEYNEHENPAALTRAMEDLKMAEGIIVSDLNRLVSHKGHRERDLLPILHHFLSDAAHKRLIGVEEGLDTATADGQHVALELLSQGKDADEDANASWFEGRY